jgi:hypothetical protein
MAVQAGQEPAAMDINNVLILFASVLCTVTALSFMELRRIRKHLERGDKAQETAAKAKAS